MKKRFELSTGQLLFLIVSFSTISILTFLLGIEAGKLLHSIEVEASSLASDIKPKVVISLENYSTILRQQRNDTQTTNKDVSKEPEKVEKSSNPLPKTENSVIVESLIQIGAYKEKSSYAGIEKKLNSLGFKTKIIEGKLTRLLVVVDNKSEKIEDVLERLNKAGFKGIVVKK